jgi:hypothetical protein
MSRKNITAALLASAAFGKIVSKRSFGEPKRLRGSQLRRSTCASDAASYGSQAHSKGKKAAKRNPDQREMLLRIAGGAPSKEGTEKQSQKSSGRKKAG